ncbi:MAG: DNA/RNA nuclease SfsA [Clostridia bacterium]|nr:DNA/RNA nuclease SfsA [Clostridia bacterium]
MRYERIIEAEHIKRDNRFIATVMTADGPMRVHVKNTGRCRELLVEGARVYLSLSDKEGRRTSADLVAVEKVCEDGRRLLINMDSQLPNGMVYEWIGNSGLFSPSATVRREVTHGDSRFDLYVEDGERRAFIEVKGVTLERDGVAMFPDAPTERGVKHLEGLIRAVGEGYEAYAVFVIQMKGVNKFTPNRMTDPRFADALARAREAGVGIIALDSRVSIYGAEIDAPVRVELGDNDEK